MKEFPAFPKIARFAREIIVTEKIDGKNASIFLEPADGRPNDNVIAVVSGYLVRAGSRNRWLTLDHDNYGFARWVVDNAADLATLGEGHHFGEWWGQGIQRGYNLARRRFSLFNTARWNIDTLPQCCCTVPVLYQGRMSTVSVESALYALRESGSRAAPGFLDPEGVVIFHTAGNFMFKQTCKHDDTPKNAHAKKERQPQAPRDPSMGGRRKQKLPFVGIDRRGKTYILPRPDLSNSLQINARGVAA